MSKIGIIIQARMSSTRLPGKVLKEINGKPMLEFTLERLKFCKSIDEIIVATSVEESDDPIVKFCVSYGVEYYRGNLVNVSSRFYDVIKKYKLDAFVRVTGDGPFYDPMLIDEGVKICINGEYEIVSNIISPRSFPKGINVEVINSNTFIIGFNEMSTHEHFEHVTKYFYERITNYNYFDMRIEPRYDSIDLTVDTIEGFKTFEEIVKKMGKNTTSYDWKDIVNLYNNISVD